MLSLPDFQEKSIIFAFVSRGDRLSFKNDNIIIESNGKIKHQSSCHRLFAVFIVGHYSITSGLLQRSKKFGFSIVLLTHSLKPYGTWNSKAVGNTLLRSKQYNHDDLEIANWLVYNKVLQQQNMLKQIRGYNTIVKDAISQLDTYIYGIKNNPCKSLESLLGYEGNAAKIYFRAMFMNYKWKGRKPRVKHDITNSLLDTSYSILFNIVEALLELYGFDIYKGVYHTEFYQRKSLVCDLIEPFRPLIDYRIRKAYSYGQIKEEDFTEVRGQYFLPWDKGKPYISWILENIINKKDYIFKFIQDYYRCFIRNKAISEYPILEF